MKHCKKTAHQQAEALITEWINNPSNTVDVETIEQIVKNSKSIESLEAFGVGYYIKGRMDALGEIMHYYNQAKSENDSESNPVGKILHEALGVAVSNTATKLL